MTGTALAGVGVLITRPRHQAAELEAEISAMGGQGVVFPAIEIRPLEDAEIRAQLAGKEAPDIVVFVSPNAVRHGIAYTDGAKIAAVGPATRRAVQAAGATVDIAPAEGYDSEHLLAVPELVDVAGKTVRIVRGRSGRELLATELRARGATVDYLAVYDRVRASPTAAETEALETLWAAGGIEVVAIMSVETLTNLEAILTPRCRELLARTRLVTPASRVIKEALLRFPGIPTTLARGPQAADMAAAIAGVGRDGTGHSQ